MSPSSADRSAIDRLLDAGVYAPVGFFVTRDQVCDDVVSAGRKQVAFARSLGKAALNGFVRGAASAATSEPAANSASAPAVQVPDYDTMTARDIVSLLKTATVEQRQWIESHESAGKRRVTILRAVDSVLD